MVAQGVGCVEGSGPGRAARGGLGTVRNAERLLGLLSRRGSWHQLSDLAEASGMSLPTVHRLLRSLVDAELAVQDPISARYGLGPELVRLAGHVTSRHPVVTAASPYLVRLHQEVSATVQLSMLVRGELVVLDRIEGSDPGPYREPRRPQPALESAAGRLLAARGSDEVWRAAVEQSTQPGAEEPSESARNEWATAESLRHDREPMLGGGDLAVVIDPVGVESTTAVSILLEPPATDRLDAMVAPLTRAAHAIARTVGHG
ncbi:IclR family transcriptional regulator [Kytococcus sedentarius]|uniref:IclR family transcriptional regulator n=1 Tax=Kytococcus sedentarius TaxID=1276 RepID=UPI00194F090C|nr:helix-turn-helix domain-containing protein [Kytococcus sedentarius]QRO87781.1 helix-turn-helix domain-containing protein [Kytococcus sedentarius]